MIATRTVPQIPSAVSVHPVVGFSPGSGSGRYARDAGQAPLAWIRGTISVALAGAGLVLTPAVWLVLAWWAWTTGWELVAAPATFLALVALLVVGLMVCRSAAPQGA